MDLMRELNQRANLTFVLVTHDHGVGERCDRIVRMRDGVIVGQDGPSIVRQAEEVAALAYAGAG
jgi:ABC-type lipoprotein export system ATPase subunit